MKKKVNAKNGLESYAYQVRNACTEEKMAAMLSDEDKKAVNEKVDEIINWVEENADAETEEFEAKQKELEGVWNPIMMKMQGAGAGAPGAGGPGAPSAGGPGAPGAADGPTIDEVD